MSYKIDYNKDIKNNYSDWKQEFRRFVKSYNRDNDHRKGGYGIFYAIKNCENKLGNYITNMGCELNRLLVFLPYTIFYPDKTRGNKEIWNILLLLDKTASEMIFRNNNHWNNYKELWSDPLWYAGVNLRRMFEGNPKGSYHHEPPYMKHYTSIFTSGEFVEKHKRGSIK